MKSDGQRQDLNPKPACALNRRVGWGPGCSQPHCLVPLCLSWATWAVPGAPGPFPAWPPEREIEAAVPQGNEGKGGREDRTQEGLLAAAPSGSGERSGWGGAPTPGSPWSSCLAPGGGPPGHPPAGAPPAWAWGPGRPRPPEQEAPVHWELGTQTLCCVSLQSYIYTDTEVYFLTKVSQSKW